MDADDAPAGVPRRRAGRRPCHGERRDAPGRAPTRLPNKSPPGRSAIWTRVETALADWDLRALDFLFIENVANLVCPSSFDLGEDLRLVLLSVTEGEDKPLQHPTIFNTAAVITKMDLAKAVDFDDAAVTDNIQRVRPGMRVLRVSTRSGSGLDGWLEFLIRIRTEKLSA